TLTSRPALTTRRPSTPACNPERSCPVRRRPTTTTTGSPTSWPSPRAASGRWSRTTRSSTTRRRRSASREKADWVGDPSRHRRTGGLRGRDPVAAGRRGRRQLVGQLLDRQRLRDPARAHGEVRREELLAGRE